MSFERFGVSPAGKPFVALLFGGDINVYSMARAFHEQYGTISYAYGKYPTGVCMNSAILSYSANPRCDQPEEFMKLVHQFAKDHQDETVFLIGCGDRYVELAAAAKDVLPANVMAPYISLEMMEDLTHKEKFYQLCEKYAIPYPATYVYHSGDELDFTLPFEAPFIVKPSNGPEYWAHPFDTQKKVYKVRNQAELKSVIMDIYGAGYDDSLIIQEFIPGDDSAMRVLTSYSDRNCKVKMMCLGHVLLEEHTPHGIGNHAVIITEYDEELMNRFRGLLEELQFTGFSNFDIKFDSRDGQFKVFEINTRQGRSNFYVTASGANLAQLLVRDRLDEEDLELHLVDNEFLWTVIPMNVAEKYVSRNSYVDRMNALCKAHKVENPLYYDPDRSKPRNMIIAKNQLGHYIKFRKYLGKVKKTD